MPKIIVKDHKYYFKIRGLGGIKGDTGPAGPQGPQGPQGPYVNVVAGTTTTLPAGSSAQVTVNNTGNTSVLNFGVPQGAKGDKGDAGTPGAQGPRGFAATVNVGETTTGQPGTNASVINAGNENDAVLKFTIPRGEKGETGETGPQGPTGGVKSTVVAELPETGESDKYYLVNRTAEGGTIATTDGYAQIENDENAGDLTASQLLGNAEQTTYSGKNLFSGNFSQFDNQGGTGSTYAYFKLPTDGVYTLSLKAKNTITASNHYLGFSAEGGSATNYKWTYQNSNATAGQVFVTTNVTGGGSILGFVFMYPTDSTTLQWFVDNFEIQLEARSTATAYEPYVGGIPAPNPSYPQPISTVTGEQNIEVVGKNLYNNDLPLDNKYLDASGNWATSTYSYINQEFNIQPSTTYTWSVTSKTGAPNLRFGEFDASGTFIRRTLITATNQTITTTATTASVKLSADRTDQNKFNECQLEEGSTATAYEPYQGQSYEVNLGKNLLDTEGDVPASAANLTLTRGDDGSISWSGTAGNTFAFISSAIPVSLEPNDYIFSIGNVVDARTTLRFTHTDDTTTDLIVDVGSAECSGTLTKPTKNVRLILTNLTNGTSYSATIYPQLERGSRATTYAPYFTPIELAKIGNYQDRIYKEGEKWYIEKQVGKVVWDGTENFGTYPYGTNSYVVTISDSANTPTGNALLMSDHFIGVSYTDRTQAINNMIYADGGATGQIDIRNTNWTSAADFKSWLSAHPTTVYYALATPTDTEITDETLRAQLNFLASLYGGENNISLVGTGPQGELTGNYVVYDKYNRHKVYIWSSDDNTWQIILQ